MSEAEQHHDRDVDVVWSCGHDGPHPASRATWCAIGCGSDYNTMTAIAAETALEIALDRRLRLAGVPLELPRGDRGDLASDLATIARWPWRPT